MSKKLDTESLIDLLARSAGPAAPAAPRRTFWLLAALGVALALALAVGLVGLIGMREMAHPSFWLKQTMAVLIALSLLPAIRALAGPRLASPGLQEWSRWMAMPAVAVFATGALAWAMDGMEAEAAHAHGAIGCPVGIALLAVPLIAVALHGARRFAPTEFSALGLVMGLFAGALASSVYALTCYEMDPLHVWVWYLVGIGLSGLEGLALGRLLLKWR